MSDPIRDEAMDEHYRRVAAGEFGGLPEVECPACNGDGWYVCAPMSYGYALGRLEKHTVREHDDGTISVRPGDGSSNSILVTGHHGETWHGYIEHGVWRTA